MGHSPGARWAGPVVLGLAGVACGSASPPVLAVSPAPSAPTYVVRATGDGDTAYFAPALEGSTTVRLLNIDAPEMGGDTQEPWATQARDWLRALMPVGSSVEIQTDRETRDVYGRVLGRVVRAGDRLDVNREQLRLGVAVLYVIWPNTAHFEEYRAAQQEAQRAGRGVWQGAGLSELPFEYRRRKDGTRLNRPAGDYFTRCYVAAGDYAHVHVNNRVFFGSDAEAQGAGYRPCPGGPAAYSPSCFAGG